MTVEESCCVPPPPPPPPGALPLELIRPWVPPLGPHEVKISCPHCAKTVLTKIHMETGTFTYIASFVIGLLTAPLCCFCLIPCCLDSFQNVHHYCPQCGNYIGTHKRG